MQQERKKQKKHTRDHWMCRIQKYSFGIDAPTYYVGFCPFFWMTWLALLVAPFIFIYRHTLKYVFDKWCDMMTRLYERREVKREVLQNTPLMPTDEQMVALGRLGKITTFECIYFTGYISYRKAERIFVWIQENPKWKRTHLPAAKKRLKETERLEKLAAKKREERRKRIDGFVSKVSFIGRFIFKIIIPVAIFTAAILLSTALFYVGKMAMIIPLKAWVITMSIISGFIFVGAVVVVAFDFIKTFAPKLYILIPFHRLKPIWDFIGNVRDFVADTVVTTYKAECPMIIWGEETSKIEKIKK